MVGSVKEELIWEIVRRATPEPAFMKAQALTQLSCQTSLSGWSSNRWGSGGEDACFDLFDFSFGVGDIVLNSLETTVRDVPRGANSDTGGDSVRDE